MKMRLQQSIAAALLVSSKVALAGHPDAHTDFVQTCNENGFASESTTVITEDGYVMQIYRIPGRASEKEKAQKPAVLFMPGVVCDHNFWVANDADVAPPFVLADQGYDVWLGNNRGTRYGEWHTTLDPSTAEYWDFNQESMGLGDLPTIIDHILGVTGQDQLTYVGHSQGTTEMFLGASLDPDYFAKKVNLFVALGPATSLANNKVPVFQKTAASWRQMEYLVLKFGAYNLFNAGWLEQTALQLFCDETDICYDLVRYLADSQTEYDNLDRWDVVMKDYPAGNGYQNLIQFSQAIENKDAWLRYDYGQIGNMDRYHQIVPPRVPLEDISVPTALFVGEFDNLATVADNEWLTTQMQPEALVWHQVYPLGHLSFTLAKDMSFFSNDAVNLINQYATNTFAESDDDLLHLSTV